MSAFFSESRVGENDEFQPKLRVEGRPTLFRLRLETKRDAAIGILRIRTQ